jgi:LemA protein
VEVVKSYARHETDTLQEATRLRSSSQQDDLKTVVTSEMQIDDALRTLLVVAENYPDLKANSNFVNLQERLSKMEEEIAFSRRYYNGSVRGYNNLCQMFPVSLVAAVFGFKPMPMFAVSSDEERQAVNVNL